jgi:hypothetical protein
MRAGAAASRPAGLARPVPGAGPPPAGVRPGGGRPAPVRMIVPLTRALSYGIPLAGAACSDPVYAVTAPVGLVSVT